MPMPSIRNVWHWSRDNDDGDDDGDVRRIRLATWPWGELREIYVDGERCTLYQIVITQFNCELKITLGPHSEISPGPGWHCIVAVG